MIPIELGWPNPFGATAHGFGGAGEVAFWRDRNTLTGDPQFEWDNANKRLVVGNLAGVPTPTSAKLIVSETNFPAGFSGVVYDNSTSNAPFVGGWHPRGTPGAPSATQSGDPLISITGAGYGASAWAPTAARIRAQAAENWSDTAHGSSWQIEVTQPTTTVLIDAFDVKYDRVTITGHDLLLDAGPFEVDVTGAAATNVLAYNGAKWVPTAAATGTITGSGSATQVAYWSGTHALTGDSGLTYNGLTLFIGTGPSLGGAISLYIAPGNQLGIGGEVPDVLWDFSADHDIGASFATQRSVRVIPANYTGNNPTQTITTAATLAIGGAPIAGVNAAITNAYSLWVESGNSRFQGNVVATGTIGASNFSGTSSGTNTGDQTITLTGAVTGSGTGSFATTIATPGTLTVATANSTVTAHTHAITSSSNPGAAASLLATNASGNLQVVGLTATGGLNIGTATGAGTGQVLATGATSPIGTLAVSDSGTATSPVGLKLDHASSGTPTTGFGVAIGWYSEDSTTASVLVAQDTATWATATHGSALGRRDFYVIDNATPRSALALVAISGDSYASIPGGLNVGSASGAGTGQVIASGSGTFNGGLTVTGGTLSHASGGYTYIGGYNTGTGPIYPASGTPLAVGWNFSSGNREVNFWNTDSTPATLSFAFRQLTGASTRKDLMTLSGAGNMALTGVVSQYNAVATVGNGLPAEYATVDLVTQGAAKGTTTLYAVPATGAGLYRVNWYAKVTRAATTSSVMGALTLGWTDATDSAAQSLQALGQGLTTGFGEYQESGNSTTSVMMGTPFLLWANASTNITYAFAYASVGATTMQYELHIKLEYLG